MEILKSAFSQDCMENCEGCWLSMALDILQRNGIPWNEFSTAVCKLLEKGRGKYRNIFLKGGANQGKTFSLNPLINCTLQDICKPSEYHIWLDQCGIS